MVKSSKVYVEVKARFDTEGQIIPMSITWEDGREYEIDHILNVQRAASLKAGGTGIRYCVRIGRTQTYLFLEENKWFVERR
ncbi:MAG TPA: hypothetical protein GX717_09525 [Clostridiaceae bacterium]|nr:hypothetical protein [Clostridiaceae bacterium]